MFWGRLKRRRIVGHLDDLTAKFAYGWAGRGDTAPQLMVSVDGAPIARIVPSLERPDLVALYDDTRLGFSFEFPDALPNGAVVGITDDRGHPLVGSPRRVPGTDDLGQLVDVMARYRFDRVTCTDVIRELPTGRCGTSTAALITHRACPRDGGPDDRERIDGEAGIFLRKPFLVSFSMWMNS